MRSQQPAASPRAALPRVIRRALALATLAAGVFAAPASALQLGPESPHSPNTDDMSVAYWVMIAVTLVVLAAVNAGLLVALLRFRARRGRAAARITAGRGVVGRVAGALGVLAVAILVFGIVISDSARTVTDPEETTASSGMLAQVPISDVPAVPAEEGPAAGADEAPGATPETGQATGGLLEIDAIAQQWVWRFEYPSAERQDIATLFSYGELVVPVDTPVVLNITSTDVIHSWWVPALTGQVQAIPGTIAQTWFEADEVGVYDGRGTVFDGTMYPALTAKVRVVEQAEYDAYLEELGANLTEAQQAVREEVSATAEAQAAAEQGAP
jgi:cytochrome c oxidase subunit 2